MTQHTKWVSDGVVPDVDAEIARLEVRVAELHAALLELFTYDRVVRPAFRAKPVGAPGSQARLDQDKLIAVEDAARAALRLVQDSPT